MVCGANDLGAALLCIANSPIVASWEDFVISEDCQPFFWTIAMLTV